MVQVVQEATAANMPSMFTQPPLRHILAAFFAVSIMCGVFTTAVSAQGQSDEISISEVSSVYNLLSFQDLEYLLPLETRERRELIELELSLLVEANGLTLSEEQQSVLVGSWLALIQDHRSQPDFRVSDTVRQRGMGSNPYRGRFPGIYSSDDRPITDTGYMNCSSTLIDSIGVSYQRTDGYDIIHLEPSATGRWLYGSFEMYMDMVACFKTELHMWPQVRSWDSIYQQLACHKLGHFIGGGSTWDLEGHRRDNTFWLFTVAFHQCNW